MTSDKWTPPSDPSGSTPSRVRGERIARTPGPQPPSEFPACRPRDLPVLSPNLNPVEIGSPRRLLRKVIDRSRCVRSGHGGVERKRFRDTPEKTWLDHERADAGTCPPKRARIALGDSSAGWPTMTLSAIQRPRSNSSPAALNRSLSHPTLPDSTRGWNEVLAGAARHPGSEETIANVWRVSRTSGSATLRFVGNCLDRREVSNGSPGGPADGLIETSRKSGSEGQWRLGIESARSQIETQDHWSVRLLRRKADRPERRSPKIADSGMTRPRID